MILISAHHEHIVEWESRLRAKVPSGFHRTQADTDYTNTRVIDLR